MLLNLWNNRSRQQQIFLFFALTLVLRILFSVSVGLIDDEAYHWSWTRDLQWSYFDHPGMIAWLEYISTQFFGDTIIAVRLPSFICYIFSVILAWKLAEELFDRWTAHFTALMILWTPFWGFGGYVASPETPFILCWLWASLVFWRSVRPDNPWSLKKSWIYLGLIMGLGLNSKFIIALLAPGFALYLLMSPEHRKSLLKPWPWVGFLLATALCSPIFFWNLWHDWPGFRYQFHDRHTGSELSLTRWLQFIAAQVLFFTPVLYFLILVSAVVSALRIKEPRWRFLFCLSFPSFFIFYLQPLWADYKPHWSGAAAIFLCIGAGALWSQGLVWKTRVWIKPFSKTILGGLLAFLIPLNIFIYTPFLGPWMPKVFHFFAPNKQWQTTYDLSNEFHGWKDLGSYLNRRQREIHAESGKKPFFAAHRYENTAQTYWGSLQKVYMLNTTVSHYTVMQKFSGVIENLKGQDCLFVTTEKYPANPLDFASFDDCKPETLNTYRDQELSRQFVVYYCKNFQGIK